MSDAFTVLWTHDTCRALRKAGRAGERPPVAFSGVHSSLPAWSGARAGDDVYALHVNRCEVFVVSRMRVVDLERHDCCGTAPATWRDPAHPGHDDWSMLGAGGCGAQAVHVDATPVRFAFSIAVMAAKRITRWPMPLSPSTSAVAGPRSRMRMSGCALMCPLLMVRT